MHTEYADSVNSDKEAIVFSERKRLLFLGLPWTFTKYKVKRDNLIIESGFLSITQKNCYMYRIQDVTVTKSLLERILHLGTVVCNTGDITDPVLKIMHVKNADKIADYIFHESDEAKKRSRTVNVIDTGFDAADIPQ